MKKLSPLRALLGVTQQDMAMILRVTRSQWAMFETGKRDLPASAKMLLAEVLGHVSQPELTARSLPQHAVEQKKLYNWLEKKIKDNELQQLQVAKKLERLQQVYAKQLATLQVVNFLSAHPTEKGVSNGELLTTIAKKATKVIDAEGLDKLIHLDLKLEGLVIMKMMLDAKMMKFTGITEEIKYPAIHRIPIALTGAQ